jgi:hypothetical protein
MEVVHERCCGLDIHKKLIVACSIVPGGANSVAARSECSLYVWEPCCAS